MSESDSLESPAATNAEDASRSPPATPPSVASAAVLRRPVGPKSRRPPTQMLLNQRASSTSSADEPPLPLSAHLEEEAEEAAQTDTAEADTGIYMNGDELHCDPVAEVQDEDVVAPARPRHLPPGAMPMLPGFGGGGVGLLLKPRVPRQRPGAGAETEDSPAIPASKPGSEVAATEAEHVAPPKPRLLRPTGAGGPSPVSVIGSDLLALRQHLRKAPESPPTDSIDKPAAASTHSLASAPATEVEGDSMAPTRPRRLRPAGMGPAVPPPMFVAGTDFLALRQQLRKAPSPQPIADSQQSPPPPSLSSLPRSDSEGDGESKSKQPPPRPPPLVKPRPRVARDEGIKASPE